MSSNYLEFLEKKRIVFKPTGLKIDDNDINPALFPFQRDLTKWALRKGRGAIFATTGMGKTLMMAEWAKQIGKPTLIIAPLTVGRQTSRMVKELLGYDIRYVRSMDEIETDIVITNYEMVEHFDPDYFGAVVLDESSILKGLTSVYRKKLTEMFAETPYKLCCTATPAPNDIAEIANHAEFLGIMSRVDMLSAFFVHDQDGWRLKKHATEAFFRWLASWGMSLTKPSDLGYSDEGFDLPPLNIEPVFVDVPIKPEGQLVWTGLKGISDRSRVRRLTLRQRVEKSAEFINSKDEQWIAWCGLNDEGRELKKLLGDDAVLVEGQHSPEYKAEMIEAFQDGYFKTLITKGKIAGLGMNLQNANNQVFVGMNDSWEMYFQSIRRSWRYGQTKPVNVKIVLSEAEQPIYDNVMRKQKEADHMTEQLIANVKEFEKEEISEVEQKFEYETDTYKGKGFKVMLGDSAERMQELEDNSIDMSIYSPPFLSLYTYSPTERDIGNSKNEKEFFTHFGYIIDELLRITKPGRNTCVHVAQVPAMLVRDGYIGMKDFRGQTVMEFEKRGWIFHGEVVIDKNPQALRNGTNVLTLNGWIPIEQLKIGKSVIGSDGRATVIKNVMPFYNKQMYKVYFSDGAKIDCDANHKWTVQTQAGRTKNTFITMTTKEIMDHGLKTPGGTLRYCLPNISNPVEFMEESASLSIDPYLMGVILGDGCISLRASVSIATHHEVIKKCELPDGHLFRRQKGTEKDNGMVATYHAICDEWHRNDTLQALRDYGLQGCRAWEKFIPRDYLFASVSNRKALLSGLLDTDGTIKKNGSIKYLTTSKKLCDDFCFLVYSLGGLPTVKIIDDAKYMWNGEERIGRRQYLINIRLVSDWNPFRYSQKAKRWSKRNRKIRRSIIKIEPAGVSDCTCIEVSNDDGLYVVDDFILTHNSQAIRTHSKGLAFAQLKKDASWLRPALADYILVFRKPGDNQVPIQPDITNDDWIEWARPVWYGIRESDTLNIAEAREHDDERHICPLQLGVIERCIMLWSNPGETIFSPFMGIGSEGYEALRLGRKFIGIELKRSYYETAIKNLTSIIAESDQQTIFDLTGV